MAAKERRSTRERKERIHSLVSDGEWHHARACAEAAGLGVEYAKKVLQGMVEEGQLESGGRGGKGYRLRLHAHALSKAEIEQAFDSSSEGEKKEEPAPDTSPAPAPEPREQLLDAAAPDSAGTAPWELPASGGITVDWFEAKEGRIEIGEVGILQALDDLDEEARGRVICYAVARWWQT